jgi:hypothetical protein
MPDYQASGIYVEEVPSGHRAIAGVDTSTAALVGPTRFGPIYQVPPLISNMAEFERIYGDSNDLSHGPGLARTNVLWYSVRAFFEEGGQRMHVSRVFRPLGGGPYRPPAACMVRDLQAATTGGRYNDGHARATVRPSPGESLLALVFRARFPGAAGNMGISLDFRHGPNILAGTPAAPRVTALAPHDIVLIDDSTGGNGILARAVYHSGNATWSFAPAKGKSMPLARIDPGLRRIRVLTADLRVDAPHVRHQGWTAVPLDPRHAIAGSRDSLSARFCRRPLSDVSALDLPFEILSGKGITSGLALIDLCTRVTPGLEAGLLAPDKAGAMPRFTCRLSGGHDGLVPEAADYAGVVTPGRSGLKRLEALPDIAIVATPAAPGDAIPHLVSHCEQQRYRVAIIDPGPGLDVAQVRTLASRHPSSHAALYYPWLLARDAHSGPSLPLPPSGFLAGILARTDRERGVCKTPANEPILSARGMETIVSNAQQEILNPEGVNCLREIPGRGLRVWGARTLGADPAWKYLNVRRHLCYLEHSIERGTQWVVFEPNAEPLWRRMRASVESFLHNEWRSGCLMGTKPDDAYAVRCDRTTMTQVDLDNGRLVCLVGVAPLKPAEFIIFRIVRWTADARP